MVFYLMHGNLTLVLGGMAFLIPVFGIEQIPWYTVFPVYFPALSHVNKFHLKPALNSALIAENNKRKSNLNSDSSKFYRNFQLEGTSLISHSL